MKVQYLGDVNDYRKFALLRCLASQAKLKVGICWMMTAPDGRADGGNRAFIREPAKWRGFDPVLFDALSEVPAQPCLSDLHRIESDGFVPGATFANDLVPDEFAGRVAYHRSCLAAFAGVDLVFFDPDNGLDVPSFGKGRKHSSKFVFIDEIAEHHELGRSVLIYHHFPRQERSSFIRRVADRLRGALPGSTVWAFESAHVVFLMAAQPHHSTQIGTVAAHVEANWKPDLFRSAECDA